MGKEYDYVKKKVGKVAEDGMVKELASLWSINEC